MTDGPSFTMLTCAYGAEKVVKENMAADGWRLAFSRPGFVTAKHDERMPPPKGVFVRTAATTIGQARGGEAAKLLAELTKQLGESEFAGRKFDHLHVWPKDRAAIGRFGFEPEIDEVSRAVGEEVYANLKTDWISCDRPNRIAERNDTILDVVVVDPSHWFFGWHRATGCHSRWPGGIQPIDQTYEPVSRAYYKAAESIVWSGFEMKPDDLVVDVGSAPGGASGRLLELGFRVMGIDPAEMDERIANHTKFRHVRARAGDLPRKDFRGAKWMLVDSNVTPDKTLVTVENIVTNQHSNLKGLILTLKIGDYKYAYLVDNWIRRAKSWGARDVKVRQLARNRCEVCVAVTM